MANAIHRWNFETNGNDQIGGLNGVFQPGEFYSGSYGSAVTGNNGLNGYSQIQTAPANVFTEPNVKLSFSFWKRNADFTEQYVFGGVPSSGNLYGSTFAIRCFNINFMAIEIKNNSDQYNVWYFSNYGANLNVWSHYAVLIDLTKTGSDTTQLYVNGVSIPIFSTSLDWTENSIKPITSIILFDKAKEGELDDFRIYNSILSAGEIAGIRNITPAISNSTYNNVKAGDLITLTGNELKGALFTKILISNSPSDGGSSGIDVTSNAVSINTGEVIFRAPVLPTGTYYVYINDGTSSNAQQITYAEVLETNTVRELIEEAFLVLGVKPINGSLPDAEMQNARKTLNRLIESWNIVRANTAYNKQESFYLVANQQEYTIGIGGDFNTDRPVRILAASIRDGGVDYDLDLIGYNDWMQIHNKENTSNIPKCLYYEPAFSLGKIFLYYKPSSASATLRIMTENQLGSFATLDSAVSVPPGYQRALIYNLALDLLPKYPTEAMRDMIMKIASESLADVRRLNLHNNVHRQLETTTRISRRDVWNGY